jgi:hypothetical protein
LLFHPGDNNVSWKEIPSTINLDYSQVELAADARRLGSGFVVKRGSRPNVVPFFIMRIKPDPGCGRPPRLGCNEADTVRSACHEGKNADLYK